ncbi:hypothetical protein TNIN_91351 [Trichonephila inaurata madagascariensis]|uniref:Uncharacterized protein n=1 Tax=Trichonephila inaurata madagascariensis TaxID=2747483 RepID=A0A8X6WV88_9ARAC|nr:hypothetical protein TNIN_91351 [Trichonephila inaurata madagascariensis]
MINSFSPSNERPFLPKGGIMTWKNRRYLLPVTGPAMRKVCRGGGVGKVKVFRVARNKCFYRALNIQRLPMQKDVPLTAIKILDDSALNGVPKVCFFCNNSTGSW